ncbi:MAG: hypothetical protein Q9195_004847 [Heterodermia aff. obscurata]
MSEPGSKRKLDRFKKFSRKKHDAVKESKVSANSQHNQASASSLKSADDEDRPRDQPRDDTPAPSTGEPELAKEQPSEAVERTTLSSKHEPPQVIVTDAVKVVSPPSTARAGASLTREKTPLWTETIAEWKKTKNGAKRCADLELLANNASSKSLADPEFLSDILPGMKNPSKWRLRLKHCEPILNATRGIAVTLANTDPHKIAPIIVNSIFAGINIFFNLMSPENVDKVLDILFGCYDTIREGLSFERYFFHKELPAVKLQILHLNNDLKDLYQKALDLMWEVHNACSEIERQYPSKSQKFVASVKTKATAGWNEMIKKVDQWESNEKTLKLRAAKWSKDKKEIEDQIKHNEEIAKVRNWMREETDPEPTLKSLAEKIMPDGWYLDAAQWLTETEEFVSWCSWLQKQDISESQALERRDEAPETGHRVSDHAKSDEKRVLWLRGGYGTGKTTIMYHTYSQLINRSEFHPLDKQLRVIYYFCNANKTNTRPKYPTILRGLLRRMALLPDFTLIPSAQTVYNTSKLDHAPERYPELCDWEKLFTNIILDGGDDYHFVLILDALDESDEPESDVDQLLEFLTEVMKKYQNLSVLCSSHAQVRVSKFFGPNNEYMGSDTLSTVQVTSQYAQAELDKFIQEEPKRRAPKADNSIFREYYTIAQDFSLIETVVEETVQGKEFLRRLQEMLKAHAQGSFRWIQIWFDITIPITKTASKAIHSKKLAERRLQQLSDDIVVEHENYQLLEAAYNRLWELNQTDDSELSGTRETLFQCVFAALVPLTTDLLSKMLRVDDASYGVYPDITTVSQLCANFLEEDMNQELRYVHNSARDYVLRKLGDKSIKSRSKSEEVLIKYCHLEMKKRYVMLMSSLEHSYWRQEQFNVDWKEWAPYHRRDGQLTEAIHVFPSGDLFDGLFIYLARYGLRHCALAAEKHSLFDPVWREVMQKVIVAPTSAFGFVASSHRVFDLPCVERDESGVRLLFSHIVAYLDLIHSDDRNKLEQLLSPSRSDLPQEDLDKDGWIKRTLFADMFCMVLPNNVPTNERSRTALHVAWRLKNKAAMRLLCCIARKTDRQLIYDKFLLFQRRGYACPFEEAIMRRDIGLAKFLLEVEEEYAWPSRPIRDQASSDAFASLQWSFVPSYGSLATQPALHMAVQFCTKDELLSLLVTARPHDVQVKDKFGRNALHTAAMTGRAELLAVLVGLGVDINAKDDYGCPPAWYAEPDEPEKIHENEIFKFFRAKGALLVASYPAKPHEGVTN